MPPSPGEASVPSSSSSSHGSQLLALRRLAFYVALFNVRGWVLYVAFNAAEDAIVARPSDHPCWYEEWMRPDQQDCTGRVFDFSDHIVLYFAQILPVAFVEFLHAWERPYWRAKHDRSPPSVLVSRLVPAALVGGLFYLCVITFLGVFKTAYYFHTAPEVAAGWMVSLLVQIPLCALQCSDRWEPVRDFLFGGRGSRDRGNKDRNKFRPLPVPLR